MFEDATFHSNGILHDQTPKWMLLAFAINLSLFAILIVQPLIYPEGLAARMLSQTLYAPASPLAPATQRPLAAQPTSRQSLSFHNPFIVPSRIPRFTPTADDVPPPSDFPAGSSIGTVPGAEVSTTLFARATPPAVLRPPTPKPVISQGVAQGMLLYRPSPAYPPIAKAAGVFGTVVLVATISKAGTIENLRVLSGPAQLRSAALEAVERWRYRPYLLNNEPVEVETTVNVVFSLGGQ
jgi:protein TonB